MKDATARIPLYLSHIQQAIQNVGEYTIGMTFADFCGSKMCMAAVVREIEIMGEASKRIHDARGALHPKDSAFAGVLKMRDRVIHKYDGICPDIVWEAIQQDLPNLQKEVAEELVKIG